MARARRRSDRDLHAMQYELQRILSTPSEYEPLTDKFRLELLAPLGDTSPLRRIRAWALYQALRREGDTVTQDAWQKARKELGWTASQVDRGLDDLVQHGLAAFSTEDGQITMTLLENEPTPEEIAEMVEMYDEDD